MRRSIPAPSDRDLGRMDHAWQQASLMPEHLGNLRTIQSQLNLRRFHSNYECSLCIARASVRMPATSIAATPK